MTVTVLSAVASPGPSLQLSGAAAAAAAAAAHLLQLRANL
jgi:hypothetical protein